MEEASAVATASSSVPLGAAVDPLGNVYVADNGNERIQKFDPEGNFITKWGVQGSGPGEMNWPSDVTVAPDGSVYVTDTTNHRVQRWTSEGVFISQWGTAGSGDGQFVNPSAVATDRPATSTLPTPTMTASRSSLPQERSSPSSAALEPEQVSWTIQPISQSTPPERSTSSIRETTGSRCSAREAHRSRTAEWQAPCASSDGQTQTDIGLGFCPARPSLREQKRADLLRRDPHPRARPGGREHATARGPAPRWSRCAGAKPNRSSRASSP